MSFLVSRRRRRIASGPPPHSPQAIVSAASGNWNDSATWTPALVPASGDTVTIANGHTVTIPSGYTAVVGSSPANDTGTPAIQTASATGTGILAIASGGNLTYKGPIRQTNANWTIGAGCTITHDSSGAAVPASANYTWQIGISGTTSAKLTVTGTAGVRTTFGIAASSGKSGGFHITTAVQDCGQLVAAYASFADWGTSSLKFLKPYLTTSGTKMTFDHCLFDRCGEIYPIDVRLGSDFRFKDSSFRSPAGTWSINMDGAISGGFRTGTVTGDWRLENAYLEGAVSFFNSAVSTATVGMHMVNVILAGTTSQAPLVMPGRMGFTEWTNVLLYNRVAGTGSGSDSPSGTKSRSVLLRTGGSNNPHWVANIKAGIWDTFVADCEQTPSSAGGGDLFQLSSTNGSRNAISFKHGVLVPAPDGHTPACFVNCSESNTDNGTTIQFPQATVEHCTWEGMDTGTQVAGCGGENNTGYSGGLFPSVRANLIWRAASGAGRITHWSETGSAPQAGTYTTCDYNGRWNLTGTVYALSDTAPTTYTNTPGTHDVTANPGFVDSTRNFLTWAQSVDGTVSAWSDALNRFSKINDDSGSVAGFTVTACLDWILAGWAPTNASLRTSYVGDPEQFMGAVSF